MELILGFIGFREIRAIVAEPTLGKPEQVEQSLRAALQQAKDVAAKF